MMLLAPVTNSEPHDVTLAAYCYVMRHGMKVQIVTPYRVGHWQRYSVTVRGNVTVCTHLCIYDAAGSRNKLGTPRCNARRILLQHEARDESSDRNSVSCQSLVTLRRYGTR
jgi:hypothetical protein